MTTFIYVLKDPDTEEIRYVGKANDVEERLRTHIVHATCEKNHRSCWIRGLLQKGKKPNIEIVDEVVFDEWPMIEAAYIQFYLENGNRLTNGTLGGDGFGIRTQEAREKMRGSGNPFFGKKHTLEAKAKMSKIHKGKTLSLEMRQEISKRHLGKTVSTETRQKLSQSATARWAKYHEDKNASDN